MRNGAYRQSVCLVGGENSAKEILHSWWMQTHVGGIVVDQDDMEGHLVSNSVNLLLCFNTGIGFTWLSTLFGANTFSSWCFSISRQLKCKMCALVWKTRIETNIVGLWQHLETKWHLFREDCWLQALGFGLASCLSLKWNKEREIKRVPGGYEICMWAVNLKHNVTHSAHSRQVKA